LPVDKNDMASTKIRQEVTEKFGELLASDDELISECAAFLNSKFGAAY
jgi:hypothetical protein